MQSSETHRADLLTGILAGVLVWGLHAVLEYAVFTLPRLTGDVALNLLFWQTCGTLLAASMLAGAAAGLAGTCLLRLRSAAAADGTRDVPPALALTLAYIAHYLAGGSGGRADLILACVAATAQTLLLVRPSRFTFLRFLVRPIPLNLILLSRPITALLFPGNRAVLRAVFVVLVALAAAAWYAKRPVRSRRSLLWPSAATAAAAACIAVIATVTAHAPAPAAPSAAAISRRMPNVVMLVMDTVRADHLSAYGYARPTTPVLQKLAAQSNLYTSAFAVSDMTLPTHSSLFTGKYPEWHGAHYAPPHAAFGVPLRADHETLAEVLSEAGYTTVAAAANTGYVNRHFGLAQGFQVFDARRSVPILDPDKPYQFGHGLRKALSWLLDTADFDCNTRTATEINADALSAVRPAAADGRPFFLFLNYMEAHAPYVPPRHLRDTYPGRDRGFTLLDFYALREAVLSLKRPVADRERNHLVSQYDAALTSLDSEIGKLFDELKTMGVLDNSLIVVTSDHGEAFGAKGLLEHSVGLYQNAISIPLLVRFPGQKQGAVVREPVSQVDVMPTILSALSLPAPAGLQGRDLRAEPAAERPLFAVSYQPYLSHYHQRLQRTERMIVSGRLKLIRSTQGKHELYDLASDPREDGNLYASRPAEARQLDQALDGHMKAAPRQGRGSQGGRALDKGTLDQLKSLGYVQ